MSTTVTSSGVTFAVDPVTPATRPLSTVRTHEVLAQRIGSRVENCSDYHSSVIKKVYYQPLLAAVHTAFSDHRPLVLSPDAIWITIAQGVAQHMAVHGERLRSRFVAHEGKLDLIFECRDWVEGSPENPWAEAFDSWANQIHDHVGPELHDALVCDFSTSGPVERATSHIVMMDIFERYFHYVAVCICGIPTVTLEGSTADWKRLREKVDALQPFDLDWWLPDLRSLCDHFVRASEGDVDLEHWQNMCKLRNAYGGDIINGWIARLFPYVRAFVGGPCTDRNPIFETGEGFQTLVAPSGFSQVPFTWRNAVTGRESRMEAIGGLVGVSQDPETLALRPKLGWAVREAEKLDSLLAQVANKHTTFPGADMERRNDRGWQVGTGLPSDLSQFYHRTNGAALLAADKDVTCQILPVQEHEPLDWGEQPEEFGSSRGPGGRIWHRFARLPDGSFLAMNLDINARDPRPEAGKRRYDPLFHAICHVHPTKQGIPGENPVIAVSFTEFLERMLINGARPYWLEPGFVSHGDAELYTRRD